jgi:hypothetical protein
MRGFGPLYPAEDFPIRGINHGSGGGQSFGLGIAAPGDSGLLPYTLLRDSMEPPKSVLPKSYACALAYFVHLIELAI